MAKDKLITVRIESEKLQEFKDWAIARQLNYSVFLYEVIEACLDGRIDESIVMSRRIDSSLKSSSRIDDETIQAIEERVYDRLREQLDNTVSIQGLDNRLAAYRQEIDNLLIPFEGATNFNGFSDSIDNRLDTSSHDEIASFEGATKNKTIPPFEGASEISELEEVAPFEGATKNKTIPPFEGASEISELEEVAPFEGATKNKTIPPFEGASEISELEEVAPFEGATKNKTIPPFEGATEISELEEVAPFEGATKNKTIPPFEGASENVENGLSHVELAKLLGVDRSTVSRWASKKRGLQKDIGFSYDSQAKKWFKIE